MITITSKQLIKDAIYLMIRVLEKEGEIPEHTALDFLTTTEKHK